MYEGRRSRTDPVTATGRHAGDRRIVAGSGRRLIPSFFRQFRQDLTSLPARGMDGAWSFCRLSEQRPPVQGLYRWAMPTRARSSMQRSVTLAALTGAPLDRRTETPDPRRTSVISGHLTGGLKRPTIPADPKTVALRERTVRSQQPPRATMNRQAVPSILLSVAIVCFFAVVLYERDPPPRRPETGAGSTKVAPRPVETSARTGSAAAGVIPRRASRTVATARDVVAPVPATGMTANR
jgi:hypothetical protein